jgi:CHAD domain-containing protein/transposase-like protein
MRRSAVCRRLSIKGVKSNRVNEQEKTILKKIADSKDLTLAKRAAIILMAHDGKTTAEIAQEIDFTTSTIQRWQREFNRKGLGIFPASALNGDLLTPEAPPAEVTLANKPAEPRVRSKKDKSRHKKGKEKSKPDKKEPVAVVYPLQSAVGLKSEDTLAEAGRKILGFHFARMLAYEPGTRLGEDIEALHDMRVATRRMRAALRIFGVSYTKKTHQALLDGLRATGQALGHMRDLDVFIENLHNFQKALPEADQPAFEHMLETWLAQRDRARREMLAYLDSKAYQKFKEMLLEFVTTPGLGVKPITTQTPTPSRLRHLAPGLIYTRWAEVQAYEDVIPQASLETLHQLRISFKQLRYTLESFEEVLGQEKQPLIKEVKGLQDHLGELNDAHVAAQMITTLLTRWDQDYQYLPLAERPSPAPLTAYLNVKIEDRQKLLQTFPKTWAKFNHPDFRRNLALAILAL